MSSTPEPRRSVPIGGKLPSAGNRERAKTETRRRGERRRHSHRSTGERHSDEQARGEGGGSHVELGPHQDRRLAGKDVTDDAAETGGEHAHRKGGDRRDAVSQGLRRAISSVGG